MTVRVPETKLLGPDGKPISTRPTNTKAAPPKTGNAFGAWAGRDLTFATLPGGGVVMFDLSKLRVEDFRNMRDHYQVNASLAVLSFMQHQSTFHVECEDKSIAEFCDEQLHNNWTLLNRAMSTSNWAGYSPNVLEWENDIAGRRVTLDKVKDLIPEECRVNWKEEEQWAPPGRVKPKAKIYDGIKQYPGNGWPIPVENSFWYPMLMENGDYYGKKLLRPAFQSWFFSLLVHLFANRYYERFGEPVPIGRAPFDEDPQLGQDGTTYHGNQWMLKVLEELRSRSVIVLPNDHDVDGNGRPMFDYDIEYLESQMRGADFERYMTRLDEEVSIALFTPILLLRTADVGSYNLGQGHMQLYLWMLNAMNADRKQYMDRYILTRLVDYNFSPNAPRAKVVFEDLDNKSNDTKKDIAVEMIRQGRASADLTELGEALGMTLHEIKQTVADPAATPPAPAKGNAAPPANRERIAISAARPSGMATVDEVVARMRGQVEKAFRENSFDAHTRFSMGFKNRMSKALAADGVFDTDKRTTRLYEKMDAWIADVVALGRDEFSGPEEFVKLFEQVLRNEVSNLS